jgi:uncharacterized membrane protein
MYGERHRSIMDKLARLIMSKLTIFVVSLIATDLALGGFVYYITPYHKHALVAADKVFDAQPVLAFLFAIVAIICIITAIMTRPRSNAQ